MLKVLLLCLIPVATTAIGSTLSVVAGTGEGFKASVQHFAAGVIFAVVAVELLPAVTAVHDVLEIGVTFAAGFVFMLIVEMIPKKLAARASNISTPNSATISQSVAIGVDILIDGLLIGIAVAASERTGVLLTLALSLELLAIGVALAMAIRADGKGRLQAVVIPTALSTLLIVGGALGAWGLRGASGHTLAGVLSFGSAALLYLVTEQLLLEAHEVRDTTVSTAMFFVGFLLFLLLGMAK